MRVCANRGLEAMGERRDKVDWLLVRQDTDSPRRAALRWSRGVC
jgi:hypothetical protein